MNQISQLYANLSAIETKLGYKFSDQSLLALAFVHCSFVNESREMSQHNERLEFLGDSVLGLLMAEFLYREFPLTPEGELSASRSRLVEASSCVAYLNELDIASYVLLGKGERLNDGRGRDTILADLFEAIIGAIFLDGGYEAVKNFIFQNFLEDIHNILKKPLHNWKAALQDYCQKKYQQTPIYNVLEETGPEHSKTFRIAVVVNGKEVGYGNGASKKEAQQAAAADALTKLEGSRS